MQLASLLLGAILACTAPERQMEPDEAVDIQPTQQQSAVPSGRQMPLAHVLSGKWEKNEWFTPDDVKAVSGLRFYPEDLTLSHGDFSTGFVIQRLARSNDLT